MGKPSRDKGARGERELTALLPGSRKISSMYTAGHDIVWRGYQIEVRRRRDTYQSMNRITRELDDCQIYATRLDRDDWYIVMRIDTLLDLLDEP